MRILLLDRWSGGRDGPGVYIRELAKGLLQGGHEPDEARKIIRRLKDFEPKVAAQLERETGLAP